jgi:hypothetical protein
VTDGELFVKPGSKVVFEGDDVKKIMSKNEQLAYQYLDRHRTELLSLNPSINVPEILAFDERSGSARLSNLGTFPNLSPRQYFGEWEGFTQEYLKLMNAIFASIRTLPIDDVPNKNDYEETIQSVPSSVLYIEEGMAPGIPDLHRFQFAKIKDLALKSQSAILDLPLYPAHRDPNPNNYLCYENTPTPRIGIVDWETFGLARKGYDEARLCTYLVLNEPLQQAYLNTICTPELINGRSAYYFWRVVTVRAFREITSFYAGHYDHRLTMAEEKDDEIVRGLLNLVERGISELEALLR